MQLQTPMKTIENLQRCIKDSNHIVAILGIEMLVESGGRKFENRLNPPAKKTVSVKT